MAERTLSEQDMVDMLEEIARDGGNAAARIAAIKMLKEWDEGRLEDSQDGVYEGWKPRVRAA